MAQTIYLLDTNVASEFIKKTPDQQVMKWLQSVRLLAVSAITVEEANYGLAWQPSPAKLALINALFDQLHAVYPVTDAIAKRAGILRGQFQAQGITRSSPDMLIAATAQEHQLIVATRNVRDFTGCGVQVINPFIEPESVG
jgi:toxin FitB